MIRTTLFRLSLATALGVGALFWGGQLPLDGQSSLVSSAEARIGRPLTPMSYAGGGIHRQGRAGQCIVSPTHATPRWRFTALLNCHDEISSKN